MKSLFDICESAIEHAPDKTAIIVRGGQNIQPADVEDVLNAHPRVQCSCVVGVPDEIWGEAVHAFIMPEPEGSQPPGADELRVWAEARLSFYRVPERFWFESSLPLNVNGKIDRKQLKAMAIQRSRALA